MTQMFTMQHASYGFTVEPDSHDGWLHTLVLAFGPGDYPLIRWQMVFTTQRTLPEFVTEVLCDERSAYPATSWNLKRKPGVIGEWPA